MRRYGQRAFVVFLEALRPHFERFVLVGRFDPNPGSSHYPLHEQTELVGLPPREPRPPVVGRALAADLGRALLAPVGRGRHGLGARALPALGAARVMTLLRRRRLVLGVRQDMPLYVRSRRPGRRWMHWSADTLEWIWQRLARRHPAVVVGPELERKYLEAGACEVLSTAVSLVSDADLAKAGAAVAARDYSGELTVLTVGRLDAEKNPLLLAEIAERLREGSGAGAYSSAATGRCASRCASAWPSADCSTSSSCSATCRSTVACSTSIAAATCSCTYR